jgi:hypothetical protein
MRLRSILAGASLRRATAVHLRDFELRGSTGWRNAASPPLSRERDRADQWAMAAGTHHYPLKPTDIEQIVKRPGLD